MAAPRYLSEPWADAALQALESDETVQHAMGNLKLSLMTIVLNPPDDCYGFIYVAFNNGLETYRVGYDYEAVTKGMEKPTFVVSGDYEVFASIQRGELGERTALLTRKLHLTGSLVKALRHMHAMETVTKALAHVECDWGPPS